MNPGSAASSSSSSMKDATWRPMSNSVSRTSRSLEPSARGAGAGECWVMDPDGWAEHELYFEARTPRASDVLMTLLPLDYTAIERILPHRYPFLLVDRVTELEPDKRIVGIKNVSLNERLLSQTPGSRPALPPTILTECVAQVGAILILSKPENRDKLPFFAGIERVRF